MSINLDNYEQFFLDHLEGNLSPEMEEELMSFLDAHPALKSILDEFELVHLPAEERVIFQNKKSLKKNILPTAHIQAGNAEEWMVSSVEGILDEAGERELGEFLSLNPAFGNQMGYYRKTRLEPDLNISFPGKQSLKKKAPLLTLRRVTIGLSAIAAILLLFIGIGYLSEKQSQPVVITEREPVAVTSPAVPSIQEAAPLQADIMQKPAIELRSSTPVPLTGSKVTSFRVPETKDITSIDHKVIHGSVLAETREPGVTSYREPEQPRLLQKVADNYVAMAQESIIENTRIPSIKKPRLNFWNVLSSGIRGFNKISDRDVELYVHRNEEGKVSSYGLVEEDRVIMSRNLNKN